MNAVKGRVESLLGVCTGNRSTNDRESYEHQANLLMSAASQVGTKADQYATMTKLYTATALRDHILRQSASPAAAAGTSRAFASLYGVTMALHLAMMSPSPAASSLLVDTTSGTIITSSASALRPLIATTTASTAGSSKKGKNAEAPTQSSKYAQAPTSIPPVRLTRNIAAYIGAPTLAGHTVVSLGCALDAVVSQPSVYTSALTRLLSHMDLDDEVVDPTADTIRVAVPTGAVSSSTTIRGMRDLLTTAVLPHLASLAPASHVIRVVADASSAEADSGTVGCVDDALYRVLTDSSEEGGISNTPTSWQGYC